MKVTVVLLFFLTISSITVVGQKHANTAKIATPANMHAAPLRHIDTASIFQI